MMIIKIDTREYDELLLDILIHACGNKEGDFFIDNMCLSAYEEGCDYLANKGLLITNNGRIYTLKSNKKEEEKKGSSSILNW